MDLARQRSLASRSLFLACATLCLIAPAAAAPPRLQQDDHDIEVTLYARLALSRDTALAPLNLYVRVVMGVASVEGPVPSQALADRAVAVLKKVKGVYEVRPRFRLAPPALEDAVKELRQGLNDKRAPHELPPSIASAGLDDPGTGLFGSLHGSPHDPQPERYFSAHSELPGRERNDYRPLPRYVPGPSVALGGPVAAPSPPAPATAAALLSPRATLSGRTVSQPGHAALDLEAAVERLRAGDDHFRNLHVEIRDGVITLRGSAPREHLMRLAQALSRLPGVRQIDLP
jgi:osmotically-inducible protein OsmY